MVAITRDIMFLVVLLVVLVVTVVVFRKLSSLLDSARRTIKEVESVISTLADKVVRPTAAVSRVAFGAGKIGAFLLGLGGRKKGRDSDGK
jgi:hypothetical protein